MCFIFKALVEIFQQDLNCYYQLSVGISFTLLKWDKDSKAGRKVEWHNKFSCCMILQRLVLLKIRNAM